MPIDDPHLLRQCGQISHVSHAPLPRAPGSRKETRGHTSQILMGRKRRRGEASLRMEVNAATKIARRIKAKIFVPL